MTAQCGSWYSDIIAGFKYEWHGSIAELKNKKNKKKEAKKNIWKHSSTEMSLKTFEMSFCALVEVECIMALYNKGRQTVLF